MGLLDDILKAATGLVSGGVPGFGGGGGGFPSPFGGGGFPSPFGGGAGPNPFGGAGGWPSPFWPTPPMNGGRPPSLFGDNNPFGDGSPPQGLPAPALPNNGGGVGAKIGAQVGGNMMGGSNPTEGFMPGGTPGGRHFASAGKRVPFSPGSVAPFSPQSPAMQMDGFIAPGGGGGQHRWAGGIGVGGPFGQQWQIQTPTGWQNTPWNPQTGWETSVAPKGSPPPFNPYDYGKR